WDDAYDQHGKWMNGPLRGYVYVALNTGENDKPVYAAPEKILINGSPLETYGWPSPSFVDMDGDGDLDLICGEFLDGFTYFRNTGTREKPKYEKGRRLRTPEGSYLAMHVQMITPVVIDWDLDGHPDIICGDEDGRVAFIRNTGEKKENAPVFESPRFFQQEADELKFGALATPVGFDWDGDGDTDIVSGNTAGNIAFFENLSGPKVEHPKWAAPVLLQADRETIHIVAGANGSIQGPCEAKWGYTTLSINDWDGDKLPDLLVNSIWGKVIWYRNTGTRDAPKLAAAEPVEVEWNGKQPHLNYGWLRPEGDGLLTQWRTTPVAVDWNKDGLTDLLMMDHEGYLSFFERAKKDDRLILLPPRRVFICDEATPEERKAAHFFAVPGEPVLLRYKGRQSAGGSGRRKLSVTDWDGDGNLDLLLNGANAAFIRQTRAADGKWYFKDMGLVSPTNIEGHDVSPTTVDFNGDGIPDFLGGAEDGFFYHLRNPRTQ
ncbi:MAG TPA: VCBS repeat-containing protein, partial [Luteolibacter sp.]|nr:VCBS repeat-containing protein [Luteolibacter sp.]